MRPDAKTLKFRHHGHTQIFERRPYPGGGVAIDRNGGKASTIYKIGAFIDGWFLAP